MPAFLAAAHRAFIAALMAALPAADIVRFPWALAGFAAVVPGLRPLLLGAVTPISAIMAFTVASFASSCALYSSISIALFDC